MQKIFVCQKGDEMTEVVTSFAASQQLNLLAPRQQVFVVEPQSTDIGFSVLETAPTSVDTSTDNLPQFSSSSDDQNPVNRHSDEAAPQPRPEPISGPSKARIEIKHIDLGLTPSEVVGTPDILQRFDTNGDGRVDLIEAARAGVAREGVFTFAGIGGGAQPEVVASVPVADTSVQSIPSVGVPTAPPAGTSAAVDQKLFSPAELAGATKKFHVAAAAAQGTPTGTVDAPKKFYGQGAEVVVGKFAAEPQQPKFVEKGETKQIVVTEDGGETKISDKVPQTDTDQSQEKAGSGTPEESARHAVPEKPAKKVVLVEVAAYADASTITNAAEAAATAVTA